MSDLSEYCFTGRLTADATVNVLSSGKSVLNANVAINTGYGDYKKTLFIKLQMWGERGNKIVEYLKKGTCIASSGVPSKSEWTNREGKTVVDIVIDVQNINIISSKKQDAATADETFKEKVEW